MAVAHRTAAGVVANVGEHDRPAIAGGNVRHRRRNAHWRPVAFVADVPEFAPSLQREFRRFLRVVVGEDPELRATTGDIYPRTSAAQRHRSEDRRVGIKVDSRVIYSWLTLH